MPFILAKGSKSAGPCNCTHALLHLCTLAREKKEVPKVQKCNGASTEGCTYAIHSGKRQQKCRSL